MSWRRPWLQLAAVSVMTYTLAAAALPASAGATPTITEFSAGITAGSIPYGITAGPDGNLWFTENNKNQIGRITPAGVITEFSTGITGNASPKGITAGPDGNLWFTEIGTDRIGRITPAGVITEFSIGATASSGLTGIAAGPDGNLWFTESNVGKVGRITPAGVVTEFSAGISAKSYPQEIAAGPDGNLWFTELADRIGRITPAGVVTEFSTGISPHSFPAGITAGPDGNLWFTESGFAKPGIARITPAGVVTEFSMGLTADGEPNGVTVGPDGNLWFTETNRNNVGRITMSGVVTEFPIPSPDSTPFGIAAGPDGNLWFTEGNGHQEPNGDKVARITADLPPVVATGAASGISQSAAMLAASVNPGGEASTVSFQYGTTSAYGSSSAAQDVGAGYAPVGVTATLSGLAPGTVYHYRAAASSSSGTSYGADATFTTTGAAPVVLTGAAGGVSRSAATLAASVNPGGEATTVSFQYGTSSGYGSSSAVQDAGAGSTSIAVSAALTGLVAGTVYHYRAVASNPSGSSYGADATFTTISATRFAPRVMRYGVTNRTFVVAGGRTPLRAVRARKHKRGTSFRYTLSEVASVKIVISERVAGRRKGKRCEAASKKLGKAKRCTRTLTIGTLTRTSRKGADNLAFSGRIGSKALKPGGYQATITATNAAKQTSKAQTISFTIVTR